MGNEGRDQTDTGKAYGAAGRKVQRFQSALIPGIDPQTVIGVRMPELRRLAGSLAGSREAEEFFKGPAPTTTTTRMCCMASLIEKIRDYDQCVAAVEAFLPYVDNWAVCDTMSPRVFGRHHRELLVKIRQWMDSSHPYTVRFGIGMLMSHFLEEDFAPQQMDRVVRISSGEYYVNMMRAWYFATALAKQYEEGLAVIRDGRLDLWTHNKAIQKAVESRRITDEQKEELKALRRK